MEIKSKKTIKDFGQYFERKIIATTIFIQIVIVLCFSGALLLAGIMSWQDPLFWVLIVAVFSLGSAISLALIPIALEPLRGILAALVHKTGERAITTPPNPNHKNYEETGFKAVLEAIYSDSLPSTNSSAEDPDENHLTAQAFNHTSCGVVLLNSDKEIIFANASAPIGYTQKGQPFLALDFFNDVSLEQWFAEIDEKAINAERRWRRIGTNPKFIKKQRFFDVIASYERDAKAETVIFLVDQTERYQPEEDDLNFMAFAAHELRGPITVIRGYLEVLEQELADRFKGDEPELMERLTVSANRLSSYISNILNVSKFDKHHLRVTLLEDSVADIYASIADDMQMRAQAQHRLLNVNIPKDLPTVAADRSSIGEVIGNLIDNAIKYSFEGGVIEVNATVMGDFVEVSVKDNGIGMPPNVVKNLFRKFYRSHRSRESVAGAGIGLYVCKAFVESHGGSISVRSRENEGSIFTFTLPIYATVADKLLEDDHLNEGLIRRDGNWIKNHAMYRE